MLSDDICNVWQAQGSGPAPLTLEELRKRGDRFHSQIARRNLREYLVMALLIPYFGYFAWTSPLPLMRVGNGLMIAGLLYMTYQLHRRAAAADAPAEMAWNTCLAFHRAELERQRDALNSVWKWYLGPLVPGMATILAAGCIAAFPRSTVAGILVLVCGGAAAVGLWWMGRLNRRAAAGIQRQIDALDAL
jgi:hypothetical protein